ncbi:MAG: SurA N-terminal domain-containing protein [Burkholderiaceae bacterium]|jgi:hypothetical protein
MLEFIRSNRRLLQFVLLLFIVPSFVVVGAWDMVSPNAGANAVATVNGQQIDKAAWENAHRRSIEQMSAQFGGQVPAELLNSPEARSATLEQMITRALIEQAAADARLGVSDQALKDLISSIPEFQENGVFSLPKAQAFLKDRGLTSESFEQGLRRDLAAEVLPRMLAESTIASRQFARHLARAETEVRQVRARRFRPEAFLAKATVSDDDIRQEYERNPQRYQSQEVVDIELALLSGDRSAGDVEAFANLVYEQSDTLEPAAKRFGLGLLTVKGVSRDGALPAGLSPDARAALLSPKLIDQLFKADALIDRRNTESVEIRRGLFASARVVRHAPAALLPLAQVAAPIRRALEANQAQSMAQEAARQWSANAAERSQATLLSVARADPRAALKSLGVSEQLPQARSVLITLFSDSLRVGRPAQVDLGGEGVLALVLESTKLAAADAPASRERVGPAFNILQQLEADQATRVWLRQLEQRYEVERFPKRIEAAAS